MSNKEISTINSYLSAKSTNSVFQSNISEAQTKATEAKIANISTVLGNQVGEEVNGFLSLDNNIASTKDNVVDGVVNSTVSTATSLVKITPSASTYPLDKTSPTQYLTDVKDATFLTRDSVSSILGFVQDSANGVPLVDSSGELITEVIGSTTVPVVEQVLGGSNKNVNQVLESLTGMPAPDESITIVALGGGAVSELTSAIQVATERKSSLLSQITSVASVTGGLGAVAQASADSLKGKLDAVAGKTQELTSSALSAVSAVEGLANNAAKSVAQAAGTLVQGITTTVGQATSAINDGFSNVLGVVEKATGDFLNNIASNVQTGFGIAQDFFEDLTGDIGSTIQSIFGDATEVSSSVVSSVIRDVLSGGDADVTKATKTLALLDNSLNADMKQVISTTNANDPKQFADRVVQRATARGIDTKQIEAFRATSTKIETALSKIDTTISGKIVSEVGDFYAEDKDLAELIKRYLAADTVSFEYVDSKEELGLEFIRMNRSVSEMIIHATETYTNANIGSEEIHLRHNEAGHDGIQYHYVIRRDGRLQRGMPLDEVSSASDVLGHSLNCIDVVLVGGVNVPSEDENALENLSSQSFTQAQMKTLEAVLEAFYRRVPGGQVMGHNAIDLNTEDPYFDVIAFVENKFGKKSVYKDPLTEKSLSLAELISKRPV
jgi:hypothetical protein